MKDYGAISIMVSDFFMLNLGKTSEGWLGHEVNIDIKIGGKFVGH